MEALRKVYKQDLEETLVNYINAEVTKARSSLLDVLKHGIEISNIKLDLMYTKPATDFNKELVEKYEKNVFSVMEEVWASDKERIDLVIFLNGLAIMLSVITLIYEKISNTIQSIKILSENA